MSVPAEALDAKMTEEEIKETALYLIANKKIKARVIFYDEYGRRYVYRDAKILSLSYSGEVLSFKPHKGKTLSIGISEIHRIDAS